MGRAVGWWTVVYLVFWLVVFVISGVQLVERLARPLPLPIPHLAALATAGGFLALLLGGREPPVALDRRDLYRLALAPAAPRAVLGWKLGLRRAGRAALGLALGGAWTLLAGAWFHVSAPFAAPALALLLVAHADLGWLRYAGRSGRGWAGGAGWALPAALLALLGLAAPPLGLAAALSGGGAAALILPAALAAGAALAVGRSLRAEWPARFAAQSLVLAELRALRALDFLAALGGGRESDPGERRRLLAALRDRPEAVRPRRSLPPPGLGAPVWRALSWRAWLQLYRQPFTAWLGTAGLTLGAGAVLPTAAGGPAVVALLGALLAAGAAAQLLGPAGFPGPVPVRPLDRTVGRALPAGIALVAGVLVGALAAGALPTPPVGVAGVAVAPEGAPGSAVAPVAAGGVAAAVSLVLLCLVALEKYSAWSGVPARRWEAQAAGALVAASPALLLGAFALEPLVLPVQLLLAAAVLLLPV